MRGACTCALALIVLALDLPVVHAIQLNPSRADIERAVAIARSPHTDRERADFHTQYILRMDEQPVDSWAVERLEVITELRRIVLLAEEHVRVNDTWGRGGLRDVDEAIRPWRRRLSIVARLALRASAPYVGAAAAVDIVIGALPQ